MTIAQFEKLALYFPLYLGVSKGFFKSYGIDRIRFVNTGGDAETHMALLRREAALGLADPIFAISEDNDKTGNLNGTLVNKIPFVAIATKSIKIESISDLGGYRVGTYGAYTTNNTLMKFLLGDNSNLLTFSYSHIVQALDDSKVDIAIVLPEQVTGSHKIVYDFHDLATRYLFSGFMSSFFEGKEDLEPFRLGMQKSLNFIHSNKSEASTYFEQAFPNLHSPEETFNRYFSCWTKDLSVSQEEWQRSFSVWSHIYPQLFKESSPAFLLPKVEDKIITSLLSRTFSRDFPSNITALADLVKVSVETGKPVELVGFWGASNKQNIDSSDLMQIEQIEKLCKVFTQKDVRADVTFILSDSHAIANQYSEDNVRSYLHTIESELHERGISTVWLSELWQKWGITDQTIDDAMVDILDSSYDFNKLFKQSSKHFQGEDKAHGAKRYVAMRLTEAPMIANSFRNAILFSYTDRSAAAFLPDMPTLFLYTLKREVSEPAWFSTSKLG